MCRAKCVFPNNNPLDVNDTPKVNFTKVESPCERDLRPYFSPYLLIVYK